MDRQTHLKNLPPAKKTEHPFFSRLNALIGKKIVVSFRNHELEGILLGFDPQHLNLCLSVDGKLVFVRGSAYIKFSEG